MICLGIDSYTFQYKKHSDNEWKNAQTTKVNEEEDKTKCDFRYVNLEEGTDYDFRVNIIDKAGNTKEGTVKRKSTQSENYTPDIYYPRENGKFDYDSPYNPTKFDPQFAVERNNKWEIDVKTKATDQNSDVLVYRLFLSRVDTGPTISRELTDEEKRKDKYKDLSYVYVTEYSKEAKAGEEVYFTLDKLGPKGKEDPLKEATTYYFRIIVSDKQTSHVSNTYTCNTACDGIEGWCDGNGLQIDTVTKKFYNNVECDECHGQGKVFHEHKFRYWGFDEYEDGIKWCRDCDYYVDEIGLLYEYPTNGAEAFVKHEHKWTGEVRIRIL